MKIKNKKFASSQAADFNRAPLSRGKLWSQPRGYNIYGSHSHTLTVAIDNIVAITHHLLFLNKSLWAADIVNKMCDQWNTCRLLCSVQLLVCVAYTRFIIYIIYQVGGEGQNWQYSKSSVCPVTVWNNKSWPPTHNSPPNHWYELWQFPYFKSSPI